MEDEVTILACFPVEWKPSYIVPGSIKDRCNDCGIEVLVAPSGQQLIRGKGAIVVCPGCALGRMNKEPGPIEITGEQVEEIKAWKRRS